MQSNVAALVFLFLISTLSAQAQATSRDIVVPPALQGTLYCAAGDTLRIAGPDMLREFYMCTLSADRQRLPGQQQLFNPLNPRYAFSWTADTAGTHRLTVDYVLENRSVVNSRRFIVQAASGPPVMLPPLPALFYGASSGRDLPVSAQCSAEFTAVRVEYFLDGQNVGSAGSAPFAFSLPLGGTLTGPHTVFAQATNASGDICITPVQTVSVASGPAPGEMQAAHAKTAPPAKATPPAGASRKAAKGKKRRAGK